MQFEMNGCVWRILEVPQEETKQEMELGDILVFGTRCY